MNVFIHLTSTFDFLFCAWLCGYSDESNRPGTLTSLQLYAIPSLSTKSRGVSPCRKFQNPWISLPLQSIVTILPVLKMILSVIQ